MVNATQKLSNKQTNQIDTTNDKYKTLPKGSLLNLIPVYLLNGID